MLARSNFPARLPPVLLLLLALAACSADKTAPDAEASAAGVSGSISAQADLATPAKVSARLGGSVTLVGDYQTELAVHEDGSVEGLVFDADAKLVPEARVGSFGAMLALEGAAPAPVTLDWDAAAARFRGHAELGAALVTGPVDIKLAVDGKPQTGVLEDYSLLPKLELAAGAALTAPPAGAKLDLHAGAQGAHAANAALDERAQLGAKVSASSKTVRAKAGSAKVGSAKVKASGRLGVPKVKAGVSASSSASKPSPRQKAGANAGVKAKASFGLGQ